MKPKKDFAEKEKQNAASEAVKHVKNGFIVGLGSGSTAAYAIKEIGNRIKREGLSVLGVPTSYQAFLLAVQSGIPITTLEEHPKLDLTIDGADQIDEQLNLIKGMGAALAREKIVASASKKLVIVADKSKRVKVLGENNHPVPIEVLPFAVSLVMHRIGEMGGRAILREGIKKVGPVITDNGNLVVDACFGLIRKPEEFMFKLKEISGVVETGIFAGIADVAYIGTPTGVQKIEKKI